MSALQAAVENDSRESYSVTSPQAVSPIPRPTAASKLPDWTPRTNNRQTPILVKINRVLRAILVACCGLAILGYGLDVAASAEVSKLQEQARRLGEQNTELSAQLLRAISFQGIQASVVGRAGLRVPERVIIAKEVKPLYVKPFRARKHYLPLMSGY